MAVVVPYIVKPNEFIAAKGAKEDEDGTKTACRTVGPHRRRAMEDEDGAAA